MSAEWMDPNACLPLLNQPVVIYAGCEVLAQLRHHPYWRLEWITVSGEAIAEPAPEGMAKKRWVRKWRPLGADEVARGLVTLAA